MTLAERVAAHLALAKSCDMGVGCHEAGVCYAPDRCPVYGCALLREQAAEITRLREALTQIVGIFSDRERYVMEGPRGMVHGERIARKALEQQP